MMTLEEAERVYADHFDGKPVDPELMAQARAVVEELKRQIAARFRDEANAEVREMIREHMRRGKEEGGCGCRMCAVAWCNEHGRTVILGGGEGQGFTGAPIYWYWLECGCEQIDNSMDTLEWVE